MTKKILLGLGATTALVGTSFAIVSCADDSTPEKTEATITYNQDKFIDSQNSMAIGAYVSQYGSDEISDEDKAKLDAIFTSNIEGAIAKIAVADSDSASGINVKFTLTPAEGFTLDKTTFEIVYDDGSITTEATITYNQDKFIDSQNSMAIGAYVSQYGSDGISDEDKAKLDAIFTSNIEGAIASIEVANSTIALDTNVKFTLAPAKGFTLSQKEFHIVYADGSITTEATIEFNHDKFIDSKKISEEANMTQAEYLEAMKNPDNKAKLDAIFTSDKEGAIASIEVANSTIALDTNVKFTLAPAKGFTLSQKEFHIVYADGSITTEATIEFNHDKFIDSKKISEEANMTQAEYLEAMKNPDNKAKLDAIFTSDKEGAIANIAVADSASGINVKFTLTPAKGFTLDKTTFDIVYADGSDGLEA